MECMPDSGFVIKLFSGKDLLGKFFAVLYHDEVNVDCTT